MSRTLIAIGCGKYIHQAPLAGAEGDARRMFDLLNGNSRYNYRRDRSHLLLSPTTATVRGTILEIFETRPSEVCLYFAGHAESRDGRLFLMMKETRGGELLPASSLSLSHLLDEIAQSPGLGQLNVIIDACNAAGLQGDLVRALAERAQNSVGVMSLSILAGAGPEQAAIETPGGGRLTTAICGLLDGTSTVQRWSPFLDLAQLAEAVGRNPMVAAQRPSYWGMNLTGSSPLAPNPRFDPALAANASPESFLNGAIRLTQRQLEAIRTFLNSLQSGGWRADLLRPLQSSLADLQLNEQVSVYLALSDSVEIYEWDKEAIPPAREAMLLVALLPLSTASSARVVLDVQLGRLLPRLRERLSILADKLIEEPRYLVRVGAGFADLYYLPLRISLLLGWIGTAALTGSDAERISLRALLTTILSVYGNTVVAVDDRQASGIFNFCVAASILNWVDERDEVLSRLFVDVHDTGGRISRSESPSEDRVKYLLARYNSLDDLSDIIQRPSELISVVLLMGAISGMDNVWDGMLRNLDHCPINMFINAIPTNFADEKIELGENATLVVGSHFWTLADIRLFMRELAAPANMTEWLETPILDVVSVLLPDRCNWLRLVEAIGTNRLPVYRVPLRISVEDPDTGTLSTIYDNEQ